MHCHENTCSATVSHAQIVSLASIPCSRKIQTEDAESDGLETLKAQLHIRLPTHPPFNQISSMQTLNLYSTKLTRNSQGNFAIFLRSTITEHCYYYNNLFTFIFYGFRRKNPKEKHKKRSVPCLHQYVLNCTYRCSISKLSCDYLNIFPTLTYSYSSLTCFLQNA